VEIIISWPVLVVRKRVLPSRIITKDRSPRFGERMRYNVAAFVPGALPLVLVDRRDLFSAEEAMRGRAGHVARVWIV